VWAGDELVGILDLLLRYPDDETLYIGLLQIDRPRQGQGIGAAACQALEREGEVRLWRYDKLESEVVLMDKVIAGRRAADPGPAGGRRGGAR
jgi:hypothetical protein